MINKPPLSFWQIWNMCFGFLGIQFGFALQNANVSRIFQTLGASVDEIPILWIAAPLTGLLVQPIVGYMSDHSQSRFGRRRPFFFIGALLTTIALLFMPHSPTLWIAAGMLWLMDASINITMEPFRAFVGDMLPEKQRPLGYLMQSFFIGIGAIIASALPWVFSNWLGFANTAPEGIIPPSVTYAFYTGALVLLVAVLWTVFSTKEYTASERAAFADAPAETLVEDYSQAIGSARFYWLLAGLVSTAAVLLFKWKAELLIVTLGLLTYGALLTVARYQQQHQRTGNGFFQIIYDLNNMPQVMKQLAVVQFFSWFALFSMWIYSTSAITAWHFGATDPASQAYNDGADWVGVLFGAYNGFAALAAFGISALAARTGSRKAHAICLLLGAAGFISILLIRNPTWLLLSMLGVGIAWASILSLPYAMLSNAVPQHKMGLYMGIFNFFIVIPQLLAASILGLVLRALFSGEAIYAYILGAVCWGLAAFFTLKVSEPK